MVLKSQTIQGASLDSRDLDAQVLTVKTWKGEKELSLDHSNKSNPRLLQKVGLLEDLFL